MQRSRLRRSTLVGIAALTVGTVNAGPCVRDNPPSESLGRIDSESFFQRVVPPFADPDSFFQKVVPAPFANSESFFQKVVPPPFADVRE